MIEDPRAGCRDIRFAAPFELEPAAEVALEDYARELTRARHAEVVRATASPGRDAGPVAGVHVCEPEGDWAGPPAADVEAFARDMAATLDANRLGWS